MQEIPCPFTDSDSSGSHHAACSVPKLLSQVYLSKEEDFDLYRVFENFHVPGQQFAHFLAAERFFAPLSLSFPTIMFGLCSHCIHRTFRLGSPASEVVDRFDVRAAASFDNNNT